MSEIDFTPEQEAVIRARLGFGPGDRGVTAEDILVALEARAILQDAERAWLRVTTRDQSAAPDSGAEQLRAVVPLCERALDLCAPSAPS